MHYAFVGVNAAGKTTITKLLTGLYDNYEGEILINGISLREFSQARLKGLFSVVYQDYSKYYISLYENILLGNVLMTNEESKNQVDRIAASVGLDEVVEALPQGYDTNLGKVRENGTDLSGGEWQRIAIARALFSPAPIRILDEPTAALDPVAESGIYEMFGKISTGITTIFITHRLGAARLADQIIVMDNGQVVESGDHDFLIAKGGMYSKMFESQRSWYL